MLTDNIVVQKIWQDEHLLELSITCSSKCILAITQVYLTRECLVAFLNQLSLFLEKQISSFQWRSGEFGDETTTCISFYFFRKDSLGHIRIEVNMELNDGGRLSKHTCCFFVDTEEGLLYSFLTKLPILVEREISESVSLSVF